jgi:hypothetical protein
MDEAEVLRYLTETYRGTNPLQATGDTYFLYDPDRDLPPERQHPYATLITGDRHDQVSRLDRDGVYRLNIGVTRQTYRELFGAPPRVRARDAYGVLDTGLDYAVLDTVLPHPVYATQNWVCVLAPSAATFETVVVPLLDEAYDFAVRKHTNQDARRDGRSTEERAKPG